MRIDRQPISLIQYGNIPIRDSPHPTPHNAGAAADGAGGEGHGVGMGWGGTTYGHIPILDIRHWISISLSLNS